MSGPFVDPFVFDPDAGRAELVPPPPTGTHQLPPGVIQPRDGVGSRRYGPSDDLPGTGNPTIHPLGPTIDLDELVGRGVPCGDGTYSATRGGCPDGPTWGRGGRPTFDGILPDTPHPDADFSKPGAVQLSAGPMELAVIGLLVIAAVKFL